MAIDTSSVQCNGGLLSDIMLYCVDPKSRLLPSGNPFKYHVVAFVFTALCNGILLLRLYHV